MEANTNTTPSIRVGRTSVYSNRHIGVLIGRFQPVHNGHVQLIGQALEQGLTNFKIFIGSANSGRTTKNPFTVGERANMWALALTELLSECGYTGSSVIPIRQSAPQTPVNSMPISDSLIHDDPENITTIDRLGDETPHQAKPLMVILGNDHSTELSDRSNVISWTIGYLEENDPVIPRDQYIHVTGTDENVVRKGDGVTKWSKLRDRIIRIKPQIRIEVYPLNDYLYNDDKWNLEFMTALFTQESGFKFRPKHVLLGYKKDDTSWYLDQFPELESGVVKTPVTLGDKGGEYTISSTDIRRAFFTLDCEMARDENYRYHGIPLKVAVALDIFRNQNLMVMKYIKDEYKFMDDYVKQWAGTPYPPIFVTTDALVQQGSNILMIKRRTQPGKGMWAMPGGFLKVNEVLETGMLRELAEETGLRVPMPVLKGSIVNREVIDNPHRSSRGRTITHVFHIKLANVSNGLPAIRGASDATKAQWVPLHKVAQMKHLIFEDHWDIIAKMIGF